MRGWRVGALALAVLAGPASAQEGSTFRLATGLQVRVEPSHQRPFLHAFLRVDLPEHLAEGDRILLNDLLAQAGGGGLDRDAQLRALADRALVVGVQEGPGTWTWTVSGESPEQEGALDALAQMVVRPNLAAAWAAAQAIEVRQPAGRERFLGRLGLPGGTRALPVGSSLARALALHRLVVRPERSTLILKGDVSLPQAHELARRHFGVWAPGAPDPLPGDPPAPAVERVLAAPGAGGPALWAGLALPPPSCESLADIILGRRLQGLLEAGQGVLIHRRALSEGSSPLRAAEALLAELDRRLAPPITDRELAEAREAQRRAATLASLHPSLPAPSGTSDDPERIRACLRPEVVRGRIVLLLEGIGRESQAGLEALGLGPVAFFSR